MTSNALLLRVAMGGALLFMARGASGDDACGKNDLAAARARFAELYKTKKYQEAFDDLQRTKDRCWAGLGSDERGRLISDLAVAAFRSGKPDVCLKVLAEAPTDLSKDSKAAKTLAFNRSLCAGKPAGGGPVPPAAPLGAVAALCAKKQELVHIVQKPDDPDDPPNSTYEETDASGEPSHLSLDKKIDLNGDGTPELVMDVPAAIARDASYLDWYLDCGNGAFYPLFAEYAADYETGKTTANGWKAIYLFNNMSPDKPSYTIVSKETYIFDGAHYVLVKSQKVKRRIF